MSDALWHSETLFINAGSAAKFTLGRVVRDAGYKVVLTGEGSDEILATAAQQDLQTTNLASRGFMISTTATAAPAAFTQRLGYFRFSAGADGGT